MNPIIVILISLFVIGYNYLGVGMAYFYWQQPFQIRTRVLAAAFAITVATLDTYILFLATKL